MHVTRPVGRPISRQFATIETSGGIPDRALMLNGNALVLNGKTLILGV